MITDFRLAKERSSEVEIEADFGLVGTHKSRSIKNFTSSDSFWLKDGQRLQFSSR